MIKGLRENSAEVMECHVDLWRGTEDKSQVKGFLSKIKIALSYLINYPLLVCRYLLLPKHDVVVVGYMGQFDILVIWLFARIRGVPICWDVFLSLYDTVVVDRKIVSQRSIFARILYAIEWIGSRMADMLILDTAEHARYFESLYNLPSGTASVVFVGAERDVFTGVSTDRRDSNVFTVLFYGQFIPLHGIDIIVYAAGIMQARGDDVRWILIGTGQEASRIDGIIEEENIKVIDRISWVPYEQLVYYICMADVCLGIFRGEGKATRVIPNKVFQVMAAGTPVITADTPAIRELSGENMDGVCLIEPDNPEALVRAVLKFKTMHNSGTMPKISLPAVCEDMVGKQFLEVLQGLINR